MSRLRKEEWKLGHLADRLKVSVSVSVIKSQGQKGLLYQTKRFCPNDHFNEIFLKKKKNTLRFVYALDVNLNLNLNLNLWTTFFIYLFTLP